MMKKELESIPIKNIYNMLCYAWNILPSGAIDKTGIEYHNNHNENMYNLFATMYIQGICRLLRRGIQHSYQIEREESVMIRGKVHMEASLRGRGIYQKKMICEFENWKEDIIWNQIIKKTIHVFIQSSHVEQNLKIKLKKTLLSFYNVSNIQWNDQTFQQLSIPKDQDTYHLLLSISELVYYGLFVKEKGTDIVCLDFIRENYMAKLFEKFVLNFYKKSLSEQYYVHSPKIVWKLGEQITRESYSLLPEMRTDIVVEDQKNKIQWIIDTKYYQKVLVSHVWSNIEKIHSSHLYQILAYVNNSNYKGQIHGVLVYPVSGLELDQLYCIDGKKIGVKTLNLAEDWEKIEERLLHIIDLK